MLLKERGEVVGGGYAGDEAADLIDEYLCAKPAATTVWLSNNQQILFFEE